MTKKMKTDPLVLTMISLSVILFIISLSLHSMDYEQRCVGEAPRFFSDAVGYMDVIMGPLALLTGQVAVLGWFANPFYLASLVLMFRRNKSYFGFAFFALLFALLSFPLINFFHIGIHDIENGGRVTCSYWRASPREGFWVWLAAILMVNFVALRDFGGSMKPAKITR